jgi:hypothetical protein
MKTCEEIVKVHPLSEVVSSKLKSLAKSHTSQWGAVMCTCLSFLSNGYCAPIFLRPHTTAKFSTITEFVSLQVSNERLRSRNPEPLSPLAAQLISLLLRRSLKLFRWVTSCRLGLPYNLPDTESANTFTLNFVTVWVMTPCSLADGYHNQKYNRLHCRINFKFIIPLYICH